MFTIPGELQSRILSSSILMLCIPNGIKTSTVTVTACQQMYIRPGRRGQRCTTVVYRNYTDVPQERCMWHCLRDLSCKVINYNDVGNYCLLGRSPCVSLEPHIDFVTIPITMEEPCMAWVRQDTIPPAYSTNVFKFIPNPHDTVNANVAMISRAVLGSQRILGRYQTGSTTGWYTLNGNIKTFSAGNYEVLTLSPRCNTSWVNYDSGYGNGLPPGSVIGGSHNGDPLYVGRKFISSDGVYVAGYYSNRDREGHVAHDAKVMKFTAMELLVINE